MLDFHAQLWEEECLRFMLPLGGGIFEVYVQQLEEDA